MIKTVEKLLKASEPFNKMVVITDNTAIEIGECFQNIAGDKSTLFNLDNYKRPLENTPKEIHDEVMEADLLIMLVKKCSDDNFDEHITFRKPIIDLKYKNLKLRVGSLLNPRPQIFDEIFAYDPQQVKSLNAKIHQLIMANNEVTITTACGTNLQIEVSANYTWINQDADLSQPSLQHSLLAGEVYGYPSCVNGVAIIDGVLGGKFEKFGILEANPLRVDIEDSFIKNVECSNAELKASFVKHINEYEYANRVGELGFGTNTALQKFYGVIGIDEKYPGNHIAFGHPYSEKTGAEWKSKVHVDGVMCRCNTKIGTVQVLEDGEYKI